MEIDEIRLAVLYQAIETPTLSGVKKPRKPGGYQDSGADIAYALQTQRNIRVITPCSTPDPAQDEGWCFPDSEEGILEAISMGATHLWANTVLFEVHPLQVSRLLDEYATKVKIIGQAPAIAELYDNKSYTNGLLREKGLSVPRNRTVSLKGGKLDLSNLGLDYPIVGKPIRGRGSHGVKVCRSQDELEAHVTSLLRESPSVLLEEFLSGEEGTVAVMPANDEEARKAYALPFIVRSNHKDGVVPYSGSVAVTANSTALDLAALQEEDAATAASYEKIVAQCERAAEILQITAPIRIDVRRFTEGSEFAIFDVNMKPNITGPLRPSREDQASLVAMAAEARGWDYPGLLQRIVRGAITLETFRSIKPNE